MGQQNLFQETKQETNRPLAYQLRPSDFNDFYGHEALFQQYPFLKKADFPSLILWGPPGSGKTTLAFLLAQHSNKGLIKFNAVLGGVQELKKLIKQGMEHKAEFKKDFIIFIDEIHRFNKAQQDALLPYVEAGDFVLIGATTEYPKTSLNKALISRIKLIELKKLKPDALNKIIKRALLETKTDHIADHLVSLLSNYSNGDARMALNTLETLISTNQSIDEELIKKALNEQSRSYDKNSDRHYDVISAFIKSMRGSDPDSAILWLAVMLDGGEDPVFIARRLVVFASEDVGNADPSALNLAVSALQAVQQIGMPEARINLSQVTIYLASTVKSNASYLAINRALAHVQENSTIEVPSHLKNHGWEKKNYQYPHDFPKHYVKQDYSPKETPQFYNPTMQGTESKIKERLEALEK